MAEAEPTHIKFRDKVYGLVFGAMNVEPKRTLAVLESSLVSFDDEKKELHVPMSKRCLDAISRVVDSATPDDANDDEMVVCGLFYVASVLVASYTDITRLCQLAAETATMIDYQDPELVVLWALMVDAAMRRFPKPEFLRSVTVSNVHGLPRETLETMDRLSGIGLKSLSFSPSPSLKRQQRMVTLYEALGTENEVLVAIWTFCNVSPYVVGLAFLKKHGARKLTLFLYSHLYCFYAGFTELPTYMLNDSCTKEELSRAVVGIDNIQIQHKLNQRCST